MCLSIPHQPFEILYYMKKTSALALFCICSFTLQSQNPSAHIGFIENHGQVHDEHGVPNEDVLFIQPGQDFDMLFYQDGFTYQIKYVDSREVETNKNAGKDYLTSRKVHVHHINYRFDKNRKARLSGSKPINAKLIYPDKSTGQSISANGYETLTYENAFDNVDLVFTMEKDDQGFRGVKYDIILRSGARLNDVRFDIDGLGNIFNGNGSALVAELPFGQFREEIPLSFHDSPAESKRVSTNYTLLDNGELRYEASELESDQKIADGAELIIDPIGAINWGTFFSSASQSTAVKLETDPSGIIYATGVCTSSMWVTSPGPIGASMYSGSTDIWIASFQPTTPPTLNWWRYVGGSGDDCPTDISVCSGNISLCGITKSTTGIATVNAEAPFINDGDPNSPPRWDGFMLRFDASGNLIYGTYIGGPEDDESISIDVHCDNGFQDVLFVASQVVSSITTWPHNLSPVGFNTGNVHQANNSDPNGGGVEVILQKFTDNLLEWTTFYGDIDGVDQPTHIEIDQNGDVVMLVVSTSKNDVTLSTVNTAADPGGSDWDYILTSFSAADGSLNWAHFQGTTLEDGNVNPLIPLSKAYQGGLDIGRDNSIYMAGHENNALTLNGARTFVSKFENNGNPSPIWTRYLPSEPSCGTAVDHLEVNCDDHIFISGRTSCPASVGFITGSAHQSVLGGSIDGFYCELDQLGILETSYYGGNEEENVSCIHPTSSGPVYICGVSTSASTGIVWNGNSSWYNNLSVPNGFLSSFDNAGTECCPAERVIMDGETSSALLPTTQFVNETIRVDGTWIIDGILSLVNCQVYAAPGSQIVLTEPTSVLQLLNTDIQACEEMWVGVRAEDGLVSTIGASIADAEYGVELLAGSNLSARFTEFTRNYVGIFVARSGSLNYIPVGLTLEECEFNSGPFGLTSPYPGQTTPTGIVGFAGILAHSTSIDASSVGLNPNRFTNLNHGIATHNSSLEANNCIYEFIQPDPAYGNSPRLGSAILSTGYDGAYYLGQSGFGATSSPSFIDCTTGVWAESITLKSTDNRMEGPSMGAGYEIRFCGGKSVQVLDNYIDAQDNGVSLLFNDGAYEMHVLRNQIAFGKAGTGPSNQGILAVENNGLNTNSWIQHNTVAHRTGLTTSHTGIQLQSTQGYLVGGNNILMADNGTNRYGINLEGCNRNTIRCNTVLGGPGTPFTIPTQSAIRSSLGNGNFFKCNDVDRTTQGFSFNGYAIDTELESNFIGLHDIGLFLGTGAIIGNHIARGNLWGSPSISFDAQHADPALALFSLFEVNQSTVPGWVAQPTNVSPPTGWFVNITSPQNEVCTSATFDYCEEPQSIAPPIDDELYESIMEGTLTNGNYTTETLLTFSLDLYTKMVADSTLYVGDSLATVFFNNMQNGLPEMLRNVEASQAELYALPESVISSIEQTQASIDVHLGQMAVLLNQLGDTTITNSQRLSILASIEALQQLVSALMDYNSSAIELINSDRAVEAANIEADVALLNGSELVEQNTSAVSEVYLRTIGLTSEDLDFTSVDVTTLASIATQCPLIGGNAVYQARAIFRLIDPLADYDDPTLCIQHGYVVKQESTSDDITVWPNPSTHDIRFRWNDPSSTPSSLTIYDSRGRRVVDVAIQEHTTNYQLDISEFKRGLYYFRMEDEEGIIGKGRFTRM